MAAPKRDVFKAAEVCEVVQLQPYVLRSWEAEFPQIGVAPSGGGPRVYRRADVELVMRIKQLVFDEGLTLSGARRRLEEESDRETAPPLFVEDALGANAREKLRSVKSGLQSILQMLSGDEAPAELLLVPPPAPVAAKKKPVAKGKAKK
jgi:DNA-binding transcriptional MerR regulator